MLVSSVQQSDLVVCISILFRVFSIIGYYKKLDMQFPVLYTLYKSGNQYLFVFVSTSHCRGQNIPKLFNKCFVSASETLNPGLGLWAVY